MMATVGTEPKMICHCNKVEWHHLNFTQGVRKARKGNDIRMDIDALCALPVLTLDVTVKNENYATAGLVTCSTKT
jgi:hypothetical protein